VTLALACGPDDGDPPKKPVPSPGASDLPGLFDKNRPGDVPAPEGEAPPAPPPAHTPIPGPRGEPPMKQPMPQPLPPKADPPAAEPPPESP
jgi:hypothetical protein